MRGLAVAGLLALALLALVLGGCAEGDPGADGDVESLGDLVPQPVADEPTEPGRCADGLLWIADDAGSLAITVDVRPGGAALAEADLPSPAVVVELVRDADPCTGEGSPATQGRIVLDRDGDGCVVGVELLGLETEDGTAFGPVQWVPATERDGSDPCRD